MYIKIVIAMFPKIVKVCLCSFSNYCIFCMPVCKLCLIIAMMLLLYHFISLIIYTFMQTVISHYNDKKTKLQYTKFQL